MLKILNWQTLENRKIQNSLILLYKTKYHLVAIDHFFLTETKNLNFFVPYVWTKYYMNSFFPRTIRHWNNLPDSLKASTSLCEFTTGPCHCLILAIMSFYVFSHRKCRSFNFMIIYAHLCLNHTDFHHFLAASRQRLLVIISN